MHAVRCIAQRARRTPPCAVHRYSNEPKRIAGGIGLRTDERLRVELNSLVASSAYCRMAPSRVATSDEDEVEPANTYPTYQAQRGLPRSTHASPNRGGRAGVPQCRGRQELRR